MFMPQMGGDMLRLHSTYYKKMMEKNRLLPIISNGKVAGLLSFYITNDDTPFIEADPFAVLDDNADGKICYVAQAFSNGKVVSPLKVWHKFRNHIRDNFSNVEYIHWNRGKNGAMYSYIKELKTKGEVNGKVKD